MIGINAPKHWVAAVGRSPIEELPEETREQLPELDFSDPYQRALVAAVVVLLALTALGLGFGKKQVEVRL